MDRQELANLVRQYVHHDTLVSNLNKQVASARAVRDQYETKIIDLLTRSHYETAVIQIVGGRLLLVDEKHSQPLTFKVIQEMLHQYFRQKVGARDETDDIVKYIKEHREVESVKRLKKQAAAPPPPVVPPAAAPPGGYLR